MNSNGDSQLGSPPDPRGGNSSAPPEGSGSEGEVIAVDGRGVNVVKPVARVLHKRHYFDLPCETIKAVETLWCRRASEDRATNYVSSDVIYNSEGKRNNSEEKRKHITT